MRPLAALLAVSAMAVFTLAGCSSWGPPNPRTRAEAYTDVPEDHPHPPPRIVSMPPGDNSFYPLRCWNNGQDIICNR